MLTKRNLPESIKPVHQKPLRLWPGIVIVMLQWLIRYVIPAISPEAIYIRIFGGVIGGLAVVLWWTFFSRTSLFERLVAPVVMIAALAATSQVLDKSIATANMGLMFPIFSIPVLSLAFVSWAVATRNLSEKLRRITMIIAIILASGFWALLRTNGMNGEVHHYLAWRWAKTAEERLLAKSGDKLTTASSDMAAMATDAVWPGFRGANRDGIIHDIKIKTDWTKSPPVEMWRRSVGPGCSSFAVCGALLYTQEQRGENEMVTCYNLNTGEPVWRHSDKTRFQDSHAGAGPRSTPTLCKGKVYTLGATGILNVLDAFDGTVVWSHNAASDIKAVIPGWGYTSSPLVVDSLVIVALAGKLAAYNLVSGNLVWSGADGGESYSSPEVTTIDGIKQILFMNKAGVTACAPDDGKILWNLPQTGVHIIQPALVTSSDILIDAGNMKGIRRIIIKNGPEGWTTDERWTSNKFRPYFNDIVVNKGCVYGLEGPSLVCMDTGKGERKWRGGRYGGQILLLADQDLLLILSEEGELALVAANPLQFKEFARFPAIKGRTWNHPVLAGDILVVRNSEEMAAFRLSLADI